MLVQSSHGRLRIDDEGRPVHLWIDTDDLASANVLASIRRFDLDEFRRTYGRLDDEFDVLDLGYWHGGDCYEPPAYEWRASFRPQAFDPIRLGM
jgi:hypothetical protein